MTLSRFLRDYLYIAMGGTRKGFGDPAGGPVRHHDPRRPLAWGGADLRRLGRCPRACARSRRPLETGWASYAAPRGWL